MTEVDPAVRRGLCRLTLLPGWVVLGVVTVGVAAGLTVPLRAQLLAFAASAVVLGVPHGAVDHFTPTRARGRSASLRSLAVVVLLYAVFGGLYAVGWLLFPVGAFVLFILLTWGHWGQGEVHALAALAGVDHVRTPAQRALAAASRGALPMLVPLVAFPDQYRLVAETLIGLFANPDLGVVAVAFTPRGRAIVAALLAVLVVASLVVGYARSTDRRGWLLDAGELLGLVAFFGTVPPILAVGLYFTCWHALRHVGRLLALDPAARAALADGRYRLALARFGRDATPLTLLALALLGGGTLLVPRTPSGLTDLVGVYLVLVAVLTLPHVLVVVDLDRVQGVWTTSPVDLVSRGQ